MNAILNDPLLQIRPMQAEDIPAVMELERRAYPFPWSAGNFRDCLRSGYYCPLYHLDGRIIGYGIMAVGADEAQILSLCIDPDLQGQGLGRSLLLQLLNQASSGQVDSVFLEVRASNRVARSLYESSGFNEIGVRRGYYPAEDGREDAIILATTL
jgi:ribosomal-protein-alanine N-acetyltransferase